MKMNFLPLLNLRFLNGLSMYQKTSTTIRKMALVIRFLFTLSTYLPHLSYLSHPSHPPHPPHFSHLLYLTPSQFLSLLSGLLVYCKLLINYFMHLILMIAKLSKFLLQFYLGLYVIVSFQ